MLTNQQLAFYAEHGYLVIEKLFDTDEVVRSLAAIDTLLSPANPEKPYEFEPEDGATVRRIWSPTQKHPAFKDMATAPRLLDCIEGLLARTCCSTTASST